MILVRNVFRLKFGKAREAIAIWKEGLAIHRRLAGAGSPPRLLTDIAGPYYTLVVEFTYPSLSDLERSVRETMGDSAWKAWYERVIPLTKSGRRELYNIVE